MQKKTKKTTDSRKEDILEAGMIRASRASNRVKIEGDCNKNRNTVISQTNNSGNTETINWPKNVGNCGSWLVMRCLDDRKRPIRGTSVWIKSGKSLKSYKSPANAQSIVFYCPDADDDKEKCAIEIDRN